MVYVLTSTKTVLKTEVRAQVSQLGDPSTRVLLHLQLRKTFSQDVFVEQQGFLNTSAIAAYMAFNNLDRQTRFRAGLNLVEQNGQSFSFNQGSSSSGLGYALALFECWWKFVLCKPGEFDFPVFATGEILQSGQVKPISHLKEKIESACIFVQEKKCTAEKFYICYPVENDEEISDDLRRRVALLGGILAPVNRLQSLLYELLGEHYDGDPLGRWEPFNGLRNFDFEDSNRFFRREREVEEFISILSESSGCAILTGEPLVGKTSFVKAGLMPVLCKTGIVEHWKEFDLSVTKEGLLNTVIDYLHSIWPNVNVEDVKRSLLDYECDRPLDIDSTIEESSAHCLIFIDHLELTYFEERSSRELFLLSLLANYSQKVTLVFTIRVEFLDKLLSTLQCAKREIYYLGEMSNVTSLKQVISKLAHFSGISFEVNEQGESLDDVVVEKSLAIKNRLLFISVALKYLYDIASLEPHSRMLRFRHFEQFLKTKTYNLKLAESALGNDVHDVALLPELFEYMVSVNGEGDLQFINANKNDVLHKSPNLELLLSFLYQSNLISCQCPTELNIKFSDEVLFEIWPPLIDFAKNKNFLLWRRTIEKQYNSWIYDNCESADDYFSLSFIENFKYGKEQFKAKERQYKYALSLKQTAQGLVYVGKSSSSTLNLKRYVYESFILNMKRGSSFILWAFMVFVLFLVFL